MHLKAPKTTKLIIAAAMSCVISAVPSTAGTKNLAASGGAGAISGHEVWFGNSSFYVRGIAYPDPKTEPGRDAKALANTFMRMAGTNSCTWRGNFGDCKIKTDRGNKQLSQVMLASGLCLEK